MTEPDPIVLTAAFVAEATGGHLATGPAAQVFDAVSIDSRTLGLGSLFLAIAGERFDGHDFIADARARGATGVVVTDASRAAGAPVVIVVPDTRLALQALGAEIRTRARTDVVAITGSVGKTSTKEAAAHLLSARYRVFKNVGNFNNDIGLPLSLIELRHRPQVAVVELGMNHPGEIRRLVGLARPRVRVWTNVGDAHLEHFGTLDAVAEAKAEILEQADPHTVVVANADDARVMAHVLKFPGRRLTFGEKPAADVRAVRVLDRGFDGITAEVETPAGSLSLEIGLPGRARLSNVLAAVAVAYEFKVPAEAIVSQVEALRPVGRRGGSTQLARGIRLVDDSYNASPIAVRAMLSAMAATAASGRRVAVLGEMLELGASSRELHEVCGRAAAEARVDVLVAVGGPDADGLAAGAEAAGLGRAAIHRFTTSAEAAEAVAALLAPDDLVLVKGSRATRTDVIADRIKAVA